MAACATSFQRRGLTDCLGKTAPLQPSSEGRFHPHAAGADDRNRTRNLLFTKQLLCRLSYVGVGAMAVRAATTPEHSKGRQTSPTNRSARLDSKVLVTNVAGVTAEEGSETLG